MTLEHDKFLRAAVVGTGYLGKFHAEKYQSLPACELRAIVDPVPGAGDDIAARLGVEQVSDLDRVLEEIDVASIAAPTSRHFELARRCLEKGVHVLVEKPITVSTDEADELIRLAAAHGLTLQVGHMQRFHPALLDMGPLISKPMFIESHRLAPFNPRGTDVNVVLDLMIHDLDIVLNMVGSAIHRIAANGAQVISDSIDIANARIDFDNGCTANITASRISRKTERKMRVFQQNECLTADLYSHSLERFVREDDGDPDGGARIESHATHYENNDALLAQIESFLACVRTGQRPLVSGEDGRQALSAAVAITGMIQENSERRMAP